MTRQLLDLTLNEISGVDHPASLVEGWLVQKSQPDPITTALVESLTEGQAPVTTITTDTVQDDTSEPDDATEDIAKTLVDVQKELADARAEREELRKERDALTEKAALEAAEAQISGWDHVPGMNSEFAPVLRSLDDEQKEAIVSILDAAEIVLAKFAGDVTKELGGDTDETTANDLEAIAKAKVTDGTYPNFFTAIAALAEQNPDAYAARKES